MVKKIDPEEHKRLVEIAREVYGSERVFPTDTNSGGFDISNNGLLDSGNGEEGKQHLELLVDPIRRRVHVYDPSNEDEAKDLTETYRNATEGSGWKIYRHYELAGVSRNEDQ
tara:strand:+ start:2968 stop:3303 length:336 start_codon:yes stop_codon:yes gene_type:complete